MTTEPENTQVPEKKVEKKKRAVRVTDAELWQLRALDAQQGRLQAEMQLIQKEGTEVQTQMQKFVDALREKYGDAQVSPDGKLVYGRGQPLPGIPGKPDMPFPPAEEPDDDDDEDEDDSEEG